MNTKKFILAAFFAVTIVGQVQAGLWEKTASMATKMDALTTRAVKSRIGHFLVPQETQRYKGSDLHTLRHNTAHYNKLRKETGYQSLKFGEVEEIQFGKEPTNKFFGLFRVDKRTVYNFRPLLTLGCLTTLYATYKLGKKAGKKACMS